MPQPNDSSAEERRIEAITRLWQADGLGDNGQSAWEQAKRVFQEYRDVLLDDAAETDFGRAILAKIEEIEQKNISDVPKALITYSLGEKWHLLRRCRQVGVDKAFDEKEDRLFDDWKWDFANFYSLCERAGDWGQSSGTWCADSTSTCARRRAAHSSPWRTGISQLGYWDR
jgi:hypothetical protein